ncbi:MAG TPA: hypothetical protein VJ647_05860 [Chitinophagaceae bacterium]|nr:hypothetical protein [Chitinophagaceae bacterium]
MRPKKKRITVPFETIDLIISLVSIIIGHVMKLIDILVNNIKFTWLSITGNCLVLVVVTFLLIKLVVKIYNLRKYPHQ